MHALPNCLNADENPLKRSLIIPSIVEHHPTTDPIRIWCSRTLEGHPTSKWSDLNAPHRSGGKHITYRYGMSMQPKLNKVPYRFEALMSGKRVLRLGCTALTTHTQHMFRIPSARHSGIYLRQRLWGLNKVPYQVEVMKGPVSAAFNTMSLNTLKKALKKNAKSKVSPYGRGLI